MPPVLLSWWPSQRNRFLVKAVAQGLIGLVRRLIIVTCHAPIHAALALFDEHYRPLLLRVLLGEGAGVNARRCLERWLLEART